MSRRVRSLLVGSCAAFLAVIATPLPAQAEADHIVEAEAKFIESKDEALANVLDQVTAEIEGVEVRCTPSAAASDCTKSQEALIPAQQVGDLAGLKFGAINNFASASSKKGSARAASGLLTDSGVINTSPGDGAPALVTLDLEQGSLAPLTGVADPKLELGAVSSTISAASPNAKPVRDYNIAGGKITLTIAAIADFNDTLNDATGDTIESFDGLGLEDFCEQLPEDQQADCRSQTEDQLEFNFPTAGKVLEEIENQSGGVSISLDDGVVAIDIQKVLEAQGLDINNLPPNTDLIPFIANALDDAFANFLKSAGKLPEAFLNDSSLKIGDLDLPGSLLGEVVGPILEDLTNTIGDGIKDLGENMPDPAALGQVLQLIVNVPDQADSSLVNGSTESGGDAGQAELAEAVQSAAATAGGTSSQTALRIKLLEGQGADLLLANSVVGPFDRVPGKPDTPIGNPEPPKQVLPNAGAPDGANWVGGIGALSLLAGLVLVGRSGSLVPSAAGLGRTTNVMRRDAMNVADRIWTDYIQAAYDWVRITIFRR